MWRGKKRHLLTQLHIDRLMQSTESSLYQPKKVLLWDANRCTGLPPPNLSQSRVHCAQPGRTQQSWTSTRSLFLRCTWHFFIFKTLRKVFFSILSAGTKSRGKMSRAKNKQNEISNPGFSCKKYLKGQIFYCLIPSGVRDINTCPSAKWMWNAAKSDAKKQFEPAWHWCEW